VGKARYTRRAFLLFPDYLDAEEIFNSHALQVSLELKWKRTPDDDTSDLFAKIAANLRNITDEIDYSIQTKTGIVTRDHFKLRRSVDLPWYEGRPRFDVLFLKMIEYMVELVRTDKIRE
jgi:hypothetical protein